MTVQPRETTKLKRDVRLSQIYISTRRAVRKPQGEETTLANCAVHRWKYLRAQLDLLSARAQQQRCAGAAAVYREEGTLSLRLEATLISL